MVLPESCSPTSPGPDNGFILDLIECFERFGELIDCSSGVPRADQRPISAPFEDVARRWGIGPDRDLYVPDDLRDLRERGAPREDGASALDSIATTTSSSSAFGGGSQRTLSVPAAPAAVAPGVVRVNRTESVRPRSRSGRLRALPTSVNVIVARPSCRRYFAPVATTAPLSRATSVSRPGRVTRTVIARPRRNVVELAERGAMGSPVRRATSHRASMNSGCR